MADFDPVDFRSTIVRFNPESHARLTKWAKDAKMKKGEYCKYLMNEGVKAIREKQKTAAANA